MGTKQVAGGMGSFDPLSNDLNVQDLMEIILVKCFRERFVSLSAFAKKDMIYATRTMFFSPWQCGNTFLIDSTVRTFHFCWTALGWESARPECCGTKNSFTKIHRKHRKQEPLGIVLSYRLLSPFWERQLRS